MKPRARQIGMVLAAVVLAAASAAWYRSRSGNGDVAYQTATVTHGDLLVAISATGTVEPEEVIDVGAGDTRNPFAPQFPRRSSNPARSAH